jgi:hypothetical protein
MFKLPNLESIRTYSNPSALSNNRSSEGASLRTLCRSNDPLEQLQTDGFIQNATLALAQNVRRTWTARIDARIMTRVTRLTGVESVLLAACDTGASSKIRRCQLGTGYPPPHVLTRAT